MKGGRNVKRIICLFVVLLISTTALADCPAIDPKDYPTVDGSTATLPLSYLLMETATGTEIGRAHV